LSTSRKWGLAVYEQDWLDVEFDELNALLESPTLGRQWLLQMGQAAEKNGLTVQYCMSLCRHALQSVEIPAVTQARASDDYHSGDTDQWNVLVTSILAHAIGLAPSKDNFWSTPVQPGNPYGPSRTEPFVRLQSATITLSAGPIAPSDAVGMSDVALIMKSCMSDGYLLVPDRPAMVLDSVMVSYALGNVSSRPQGYLATASSVVGGLEYTNVLAVLLGAPYSLSITEMGYGATDALVAVEVNATSTVLSLSSGQSLSVPACGKMDFRLYAVSPRLWNGWAVLGELSKWVPVNSRRFTGIQADTDGVTVGLRGAPGECVLDTTMTGVLTTTMITPTMTMPMLMTT
jgi:hypothetical protein